MAGYKFKPRGSPRADGVRPAQKIRAERGEKTIVEVHLADSIVVIVEHEQASLTGDRLAKNPYG